jgi:hypothetical protein
MLVDRMLSGEALIGSKNFGQQRRIRRIAKLSLGSTNRATSYRCFGQRDLNIVDKK